MQTAKPSDSAVACPIKLDMAFGRYLARRRAHSLLIRPRTYNDIRPLSNPERKAAWAARYYLTQSMRTD